MPELKRALNKKIQELLKSFPAVVLVGASQVGKTTLLKDPLKKATSSIFRHGAKNEFALGAAP
jgi:predicted AAA+ superfamily ATPase